MNRSRPSRREVSERLRADVPATPADDPFVATLAHAAASRFPTRATSASAVRTLHAARGFKVAAASTAVAVVMAGGAYAAARVDRDGPAAPAPATDGSSLHGEDLSPVDSDGPDQTDDDALEVEDQTTLEHDEHADDHADDGDSASEHSADQGDQDSQDDQQADLSDGPDADDSGSQQVSPPTGDRDSTGTRDHEDGDDTSDDTDEPENDGADDSGDSEDADGPGDAETDSSDDDDASEGSEADDGSDDSESGDASDDSSSGETDSTTR
jgi:hypothetical protein